MERLQQFLDRIISLGSDPERPPRSLDLTPLDVFVRSYLKSKVFFIPQAILVDLRQRITMEAAQIPQDMIIRARTKCKEELNFTSVTTEKTSRGILDYELTKRT